MIFIDIAAEPQGIVCWTLASKSGKSCESFKLHSVVISSEAQVWVTTQEWLLEKSLGELRHHWLTLMLGPKPKMLAWQILIWASLVLWLKHSNGGSLALTLEVSELSTTSGGKGEAIEHIGKSTIPQQSEMYWGSRDYGLPASSDFYQGTFFIIISSGCWLLRTKLYLA